MLNAAFIIRFHYPEDDPRVPFRLSYFRDRVLPRIREQTYRDFDICVRCYPHHAQEFRDMGCIPFHVDNEGERYRLKNSRRWFVDFVSWDHVMGLPQYPVQMGLDSDDLIAPDYVSLVMDEVEKANGVRTHIFFQPGVYYYETDRYALNDLGPSSTYTGSAFFAIYPPPGGRYDFAYQRGHLRMPCTFDRRVVIPYGHCWATVHHCNETTTGRGGQTR